MSSTAPTALPRAGRVSTAAARPAGSSPGSGPAPFTRPAAFTHFRGFDTLARLLGATLGPVQGPVVAGVGSSAEVLSDSGTLARRITGLGDTAADTGAWIVRDMVRTVARRHGDGGATAAVLARSTVRHAARALAAGAEAVALRRGIQAAAELAAEHLEKAARPVGDEEDLTRLAVCLLGEQDLGERLGGMCELLGPDGAVVIETHEGRLDDHHYPDGPVWKARPAQRETTAFGTGELTLHDPVVIAVDQELSAAADLRPVLERLAALPVTPPVLLLAPKIGGEALTLCEMNDRAGGMVIVPAVCTGSRVRVGEELADLALVTGGTVLSPDTGNPLRTARPGDLGRARQVVLRRNRLTVVGGEGDPAAAREKAARLRARVAELEPGGPQDAQRERLWRRQGRLTGRTGTIRVGGGTEEEAESRTEEARRCVTVLRRALDAGLLPGGGAALAHAAQAVEDAAARCANRDEAQGMRALAAALPAPLLRIAANAGAPEPLVVLHAAREAGPGHGFDARTRRVADMTAAGVVDSAAVVTGALRAAAHTAGLLVAAESVPAPGRR